MNAGRLLAWPDTARGARRAWCGALLAAFALWAVSAAWNTGGQRVLFFEEGRDLLGDFWMPKTCLEEGYAPPGEDASAERSGWFDGRMRVCARDRCYPAPALMPLKLFSATWGGAWAWTACVALAFAAALCAVARGWWPLALMGTMPVLFTVERGNAIGLSAAAVAVFLAWYKSERLGRRRVAALALACAACLKVSPALLGLLYLPRRDWKSMAWCAAFGAVLFVVPWWFVPGGFAALPDFVANVGENAVAYARSAEFGLVPVWRAVRILLGQDCQQTWSGCMAALRASQAAGMALVSLGAWRRSECAAVVGMLWAAGNMHYYGALYLVPLFALALARPTACALPRGRRFVQAACWFAILCPVQLVVSGHAANALLCNAAAAVLAVLHVSRPSWKVKMEEAT